MLYMTNTDPGISPTTGPFNDPQLSFTQGVAAIDAVTLKLAVRAAKKLDLDIRIPTIADVEVPRIFQDLCTIECSLPGPLIRATIDTKLMTWSDRLGPVSRTSFMALRT